MGKRRRNGSKWDEVGRSERRGRSTIERSRLSEATDEGPFGFFCGGRWCALNVSYVTVSRIRVRAHTHTRILTSRVINFVPLLLCCTPCAVRYFAMNSDILELNLVPATHFTALSFIPVRLSRYRDCFHPPPSLFLFLSFLRARAYFYKRNISVLTSMSTLYALSLSFSFLPPSLSLRFFSSSI